MSVGKNISSFRMQVSVMLIGFALFALLMPDRQRGANELKPSEMIVALNSGDAWFSCDQVARLVVNEDPALQLIDLREPDKFLGASIPGAINIPFRDILNPDWAGYLDDPGKTVVFYSDADSEASQAWMLCKQFGYQGIKFMEGGMEEWHELIMKSEFSGERISASENAIFETRYRARDFFITMNSLPDSLKNVYLTVKRKEEAELTGGCE
jgi:rhodanese-related sulfurtransferase